MHHNQDKHAISYNAYTISYAYTGLIKLQLRYEICSSL